MCSKEPPHSYTITFVLVDKVEKYFQLRTIVWEPELAIFRQLSRCYYHGDVTNCYIYFNTFSDIDGLSRLYCHPMLYSESGQCEPISDCSFRSDVFVMKEM